MGRERRQEKEDSKHQTACFCFEGSRAFQTSVKSLRRDFPKYECLLKNTDGRHKQKKTHEGVKVQFRTDFLIGSVKLSPADLTSHLLLSSTTLHQYLKYTVERSSSLQNG